MPVCEIIRWRGDLRHRKIIRAALGKFTRSPVSKRKASFQSLGILLRQLAAETKWAALNHLDKYLV